jgi:hypothetical protein
MTPGEARARFYFIFHSRLADHSGSGWPIENACHSVDMPVTDSKVIERSHSTCRWLATVSWRTAQQLADLSREARHSTEKPRQGLLALVGVKLRRPRLGPAVSKWR